MLLTISKFHNLEIMNILFTVKKYIYKDSKCIWDNFSSETETRYLPHSMYKTQFYLHEII